MAASLLKDSPKQLGKYCLKTMNPMQGKLSAIEGKEEVIIIQAELNSNV